MENKNISAAQALQFLMEGNQRFVTGVKSMDAHVNPSRRKELAEKGQRPFAIVLACADSRVPAELVFDRGLGDLFVIRVAGNVVAPSLIASIEFAAESFESALCVVMGHSQCGAIKLAVETEANRSLMADHSPNVRKLLAKILPAVKRARNGIGSDKSKDLEYEATWSNIRRSVRLLSKRSDNINHLVEAGKLMIVGAQYNLRSGEVDFDLSQVDAQKLLRQTMTKGEASWRG